MKTLIAPVFGLVTALMIAAPGTAHATYMCDKLFAETHGTTCPAGSTWDTAYHACIATGS